MAYRHKNLEDGLDQPSLPPSQQKPSFESRAQSKVDGGAELVPTWGVEEIMASGGQAASARVLHRRRRD
jgi:hypothetical protein